MADKVDFNPRTPCGVRLSPSGNHPVRINFNPRTPCGVRPARPRPRGVWHNFNPRTPCGVRQQNRFFRSTLWIISIHAPRAGCDLAQKHDGRFAVTFHSTHPVRGATHTRRCNSIVRIDFNPRTPCGVRRQVAAVFVVGDVISIHAPRAGCDPTTSLFTCSRSTFQSTHPVRGATRARVMARETYSPFQSTHPVRGATANGQRGGRRGAQFQSTHPVRGATFSSSRSR